MRWTLPALLLLLCLSASPAAAQCRLCEGGASVTAAPPPAVPVRLEVETSLDFDKLVLIDPSGGSALLGPDGTRLTRGALEGLSARAMTGELTIRGEPHRGVRVNLPHRIELFGAGGGSLVIRDLQSDLPAAPRLDGEGRLRIRFGGELLVSGEAEGDYRGDIAITVDYL